MEDLKKQECKNCGATLNFDPSQVSMKCAFCGSEFFVEIPETEEDKKRRENASIITFKITSEEADTKFSEWIKKGLFKPSNLASTFKKEKFEGVYIPFQKVTADATSNWEGQDKILINEAADGEPADYDYEDRSGTHSDSYKDFIAATKGLEQAEVDAILPFDDNDTKPYNRQLMTGYKFEEPVLTEENAIAKAKERIKGWERDKCASESDELLNCNTTVSNISSKLMMLPLWILVYSYNNKPFRVLINGQTGKLSGNKPVSKIKVAITLFIIAAIIGGIVFAKQMVGK